MLYSLNAEFESRIGLIPEASRRSDGACLRRDDFTAAGADRPNTTLCASIKSHQANTSNIRTRNRKGVAGHTVHA